jgi:hypothetical protein
VRTFFEWFREEKISPEEPWLILGKGPSYSRRSQFDVRGYRLISLNHVVREEPVTAAHLIDYDVVEACGDAIERNAQVLVMPWVPHVNQKVGRKTLEDYAKESERLARLDREGRLLWYNLKTHRDPRPGSPVIDVGFFSSEAVLNLLTAAEVRRVRSLGIDGGAAYSPAFDDLRGTTLLAGRRSPLPLAGRWTTFDHQFAGIARCILDTGVDYAPLDVESPIRVYVGATEEQMLAVKVLEYSIRKHCSVTVEVLPLHQASIEIPQPKDPRNIGKTPFSFQRFVVPELAGRRGRAIYLDSDMQVFRDIRTLWMAPFEGAQILTCPSTDPAHRRPQFSVMVMDCSALAWDVSAIVRDLDEGKYTYEQVMYEMALAPRVRQSIDPVWNSLERYEEDVTALIHYTDMPTQPWVYRENPFGYVWMRELFEAIDRKFITEDFIADHVQRGWVRPTLLYQVRERIEDGVLLPRAALELDRHFVYPWELKELPGRRPWLRPFRIVRSGLRQRYYRSAPYRLVRKLRLWARG